MALPKVIINVSDGGLGRLALPQDSISGFVIYNDNIANLTTFTTISRIHKFTSLASIEATGITSASTNFKDEWYQLKEYFRLGGGDIWVGVFDEPVSAYDFTELTDMQQLAIGEIRLFGIVNKEIFNTTDIALLNSVLEDMWAENRPAIGIFGQDTKTLTLATLPDLRNLPSDCPRVSVVIGQDMQNYPASVTGYSIPNVGAVLGALSSTKVSTNILEVAKFNYTDGVQMVTPGFFVDGALLPVNDISLSESDLDLLNDKGYIFFRFLDINGTYLSNDNNSTDITSDFASIHNNRVIGKAIREVNISILPLLGSPIRTKGGIMTPGSVNVFTNAASAPLRTMRDADEISEFSVFIDPTQNVAATNTIILQITIVPIFTADKIVINLGFATTI